MPIFESFVLKVISISKEKFTSYWKDLGLFLTKPRKFFLEFFKRDAIEKLYQVLFIVIVSSLLALIFSEKESLRSTLKIVVLDIFILIWIYIPLLLSNVISASFFKEKKIGWDNILYFLIISKFSFIILFIIVNRIFHISESYEIYFIFNFIYFLYFLFLIFYSVLIFLKKAGSRIVSILFNLIFINLVWIIFLLFSFDNVNFDFQTIRNDKIAIEFNRTLDEMDLINKVPAYRIIVSNTDTSIHYFNFHFRNTRYDAESIATNIDYDYREFQTMYDNVFLISNNQDSILNNLNYQRNKQHFKKWGDYCDLVIYEYNKPIRLETLSFKDSVTIESDNQKIDDLSIAVYTNDNNVYENYKSLIRERDAFYKTKRIAEIPVTVIGVFLFPVAIVAEKYHN